jgi:hypothetical protein
MCVTIDEVWIGGLDILTTCAHHSELQVANYSTTANFHNSQITTAPAIPFSSLLCLQQPFPSNGF